jgi:hypothetical protein
MSIPLDRISKEIMKLVDSSPKPQIRLAEYLTATLLRINRFWEVRQQLFSVMKKAENKRETHVIASAIFLWTFEGSYMDTLNTVCALLIANEHDLFDPLRREYVREFEDIEKVDLSTKSKFLGKHGFVDLVRKQDQRLRNDIAHANFEITDSGIVMVNGQVFDIFSRIAELQGFLLQLNKGLFIALAKDSGASSMGEKKG